ncbi:MAG TPA: hypothetical protein VGG64_15080 [Pirellulales bacterium]|jgi:hypothetical protein
MTERTSAHHRWWQFGLFAGGTIVVCLFVWQFALVRERQSMRAFIKAKGGVLRSLEEWRPARQGEGTVAVASHNGIPFWRRWLGDEAVADILWPRGLVPSDIQRTQALFPEAEQRMYVAPVNAELNSQDAPSGQ